MIAETKEVLPDPTAPATPNNSPLRQGMYQIENSHNANHTKITSVGQCFALTKSKCSDNLRLRTVIKNQNKGRGQIRSTLG